MSTIIEKEVKLSTLMRIGAKKTHQVVGTMMSDREGTCALGAAKVGMSEILGVDYYNTPNLEDEDVKLGDIPGEAHPYINRAWEHLSTVVINLNDEAEWSREKIAQWIDDLHEKGYDVTMTLEVELQSQDLKRVNYTSPPHLDESALRREETWDSVPEQVTVTA